MVCVEKDGGPGRAVGLGVQFRISKCSLADGGKDKLHTLKVRLQRGETNPCASSSDQLSQLDRVGYRINHSPFMCHHACRGWITYSLRGHPTIPSMIPMVLPDDTSTGCTPHGQTALAGILPSGFTPSSGSDVVRSIGSRLPTPAVARTNIYSSKEPQRIHARQSQPMEPAFNAARRHGHPRCKTRVPVGSIRSRDHPIQGNVRLP